MLTTFGHYKLITRDLQKSLARTASEPQIAREVKYYKENIGRVKSIPDLLKDHRLFTFAMKAHGLEDMIYAKAFMRKVLAEGIDATSAFANRLQDERYKDFVNTFNFARYGETATIFGAAQQGTVDKYVRQSLEASTGAESPALRLALYFERKAPSIKGPFDILADPALSQVVRTALGIPEGAAAGNIDAQAAMITKRYDVAKFQNPAEVQRFLQRFTTMWDAQAGSASAIASPLIVSPSGTGIGIDLLLSLQQIKFGRR